MYDVDVNDTLNLPVGSERVSFHSEIRRGLGQASGGPGA